MKLVAISGGKLLSKDMYMSLGFGSHPCELSTLTLMLGPAPGTAEVAAALRNLADRVARLKSTDEECSAALAAMLRAGTEPLRQGGKKTRSRSVAPAPQRENPMANKKTAKKIAKKTAKKKGC